MTDTLAEKLRQITADDNDEADVLFDAADRIEALETALREIISNNPIHGDAGSASIKDIVDAIIRSSTIARAALGEKK